MINNPWSGRPRQDASEHDRSERSLCIPLISNSRARCSFVWCDVRLPEADVVKRDSGAMCGGAKELTKSASSAHHHQLQLQDQKHLTTKQDHAISSCQSKQQLQPPCPTTKDTTTKAMETLATATRATTHSTIIQAQQDSMADRPSTEIRLNSNNSSSNTWAMLLRRVPHLDSNNSNMGVLHPAKAPNARRHSRSPTSSRSLSVESSEKLCRTTR